MRNIKEAFEDVASRVDDAVFLRRFHGWCTIFFIALWIAGTILDWIASVKYVSHLSQAALVLGSFSSWQASRAEVKIDKQKSSAKLK